MDLLSLQMREKILEWDEKLQIKNPNIIEILIRVSVKIHCLYLNAGEVPNDFAKLCE